MCKELEELALRYELVEEVSAINDQILAQVFVRAREKQNLDEPGVGRDDFNTYDATGRKTLPVYVRAEYDHGV